MSANNNNNNNNNNNHKKRGHSRSSSYTPFDFDLQRNINNKIEIKTFEDKDSISALDITGKIIKKSIHTVGELAKVPTKVLRGSAPTVEQAWSPTIPSAEDRKQRSVFLGGNSDKRNSCNNNHNNNNNNFQNGLHNILGSPNSNKYRVKEGDFLKPGSSTYPSYNQISAFPETQIENIPALQTVPIPSFIFTNILFDPKAVSIPNVHEEEQHCPIFMIAGPEDGLFECVNDLPTRRQQLLQMKHNLTNNINISSSPNELTEKEPILMEDLKKKLLGLNKIEKKLKKCQFILQKVQNDKRDKKTESRIYGISTDSYAYDYIKAIKAGQPNCDSYFAQTFDNTLCFCVADGIGWGLPSRRAAQSASLGFMLQFNSYLLKSVISKKKKYGFNTLNFAKNCKEAVYLSQLCIFSNTESKTTMAGGIISPLFLQSNEYDSDPLYHSPDNSPPSTSSSSDDDDEDDKDLQAFNTKINLTKKSKKRWVFVGFSVGDSLIYRYSSTNEEIIEVSTSDRSGGMRDAGGNLGGSTPDLSNLNFYCCLVEEGDFLIAVSDGVHDNFDPEVLKIPPHSHSSWADLSLKEKSKLKKEFKEDKLLEIIEDIEDELTASSISKAVVDYVMKVTSDYRDAYEMGSKLQRDWGSMDDSLRTKTNQLVQQKLKTPIGKFDHVTCLTVRVGYGSPCPLS